MLLEELREMGVAGAGEKALGAMVSKYLELGCRILGATVTAPRGQMLE